VYALHIKESARRKTYSRDCDYTTTPILPFIYRLGSAEDYPQNDETSETNVRNFYSLYDSLL